MPCARAAPAPALTPPLLPVTGTCSSQALGGTCAMLLTVLLKRSCFLMCATAETARLGFPQGLTSLLTSTGNCGGYTSKSGKVTGTHGQQARNSTTRKRNPGNTWENLQFQEARGARCGPRVAGLPCSPRQPCGDSPASPEHPDGPRMLLVALGTGSVVSPCPGQQ